MKQSVKWFIAILLVPVFLVTVVYFLNRNNAFAVDLINIEVLTLESQKKYPQPYIEKIQTKLSVFKGQPLWSVSLRSISKILQEERWIEQFRISREWPSEIKLFIQPHEISYLLWQSKKSSDGVFFPVTDRAEILPPIDSTQTPPRAILKGEVFFKDVNQRKKAIEILHSLPNHEIINSQKLAEVSYDKKEGFWIKLINNDTQIKLGESDFQMKSARVSEVLDYLEKKDLKARVIDANLSKKVLVRLH
jgi:cell division protein FtsQ